MKKTVVVTGASGAIGEDCARVFAQKDFNIAVHYNKNRQKAEDFVSMLRNNGVNAKAFGKDLSEERECEALMQEVFNCFGSLDVLVNNAGISLVKPFLETSGEEGERIIKTDLLSAMYCSKYAAEKMLKSKSGCIINISSVWGVCGASCEVYYSAAKAGMIGFTKALASEFAPSNIRVNAVAPGVIDTPMNNFLSQDERKALKNEIPLLKFGCGYDVAKAVYFLASDDAEYITGQVINVNGGFLM